jgi:hydrogenase maturation protease
MRKAEWYTAWFAAEDGMRADTLIIGYGNPSRGDDALGPVAIEAIAHLTDAHPEWGGIELLTDFQLQIEFVTDLAERRRIVFIDAASSGAKPFSFARLQAKPDASVTTHALSPASLLAVFRSFYGEDAPSSHVLGIRGYAFELGEPLSDRARGNLDAALAMLGEWLRREVEAVV